MHLQTYWLVTPQQQLPKRIFLNPFVFEQTKVCCMNQKKNTPQNTFFLIKFRITLSATTKRNTEHTITSGITTCGAVDGTAASGT